MPDTNSRLATILPRLALVLAACSASLYVGYRIGVGRAFIRDKELAKGPDVLGSRAAEWEQQDAAAPEGVPVTRDPPKRASTHSFAIDAAKPLRITWPLDVGRDKFGDERICLRARQGANELQLPGAGKAFYPVLVTRPGQYTIWCRARWLDDRVGSIDCNNSWFVGIDAAPAVVVGNKSKRTDWHWQPGPAAELEAGVHWLRVELREDGVRMDRLAVVPNDLPATPSRLEALDLADFSCLAGERPPMQAHRPVQSLECWASPTGSLTIGAGHANAITLAACYQGKDGAGFVGSIDVRCPSAPGVVVEGDGRLILTLAQPQVQRTLGLKFPPDAPRRVHRVLVSLRGESGESVFEQELRFVRACAWAFLGPFGDSARGRARRRQPALERLAQDCDGNPMAMARLADAAALGLDKLAMATRGDSREWRTVADGSCYDWTGAVDLLKVYDAAGPAFAYAVTWINAETNLHHRSFTCQIDDSGWAWVGGHTVASMPIDLPREAQRLWTSARLRKGPNPVVIKLTQNERYWGFRFDVVDWHYQGRRGDVITGLEPTRWPER